MQMLKLAARIIIETQKYVPREDIVVFLAALIQAAEIIIARNMRAC